MNTIQIEEAVVRQALEALESIWEGGLESYPATLHANIMDALRRALEQETQSVNATGGPKAHFSLAEQPEFVLPGGGYIPATPCPRSKLQK